MSLPRVRAERSVVIVASAARRRRLALLQPRTSVGSAPRIMPGATQPAPAASRPTDAGLVDWPLERWTGPVYALGSGRAVRRARRWREGVTVLALVGGAAMLLAGSVMALAGMVVLAVTVLLALPWPRRWWAAWLTPATAVRAGRHR